MYFDGSSLSSEGYSNCFTENIVVLLQENRGPLKPALESFRAKNMSISGAHRKDKLQGAQLWLPQVSLTEPLLAMPHCRLPLHCEVSLEMGPTPSSAYLPSCRVCGPLARAFRFNSRFPGANSPRLVFSVKPHQSLIMAG